MEAAAELGFHCAIAWDRHGTDGALDALLWPEGEQRPQTVPFPAPQDLDGPLDRWANHPTRGRFARRVLPELRTFLEDRLPDYMVPTSFALLEDLPLTPNGKLDRQALPEPELGRSTSDSAELTAPRNATEEQLTQIWARVLDRGRVGVDQNFFDLGGPLPARHPGCGGGAQGTRPGDRAAHPLRESHHRRPRTPAGSR